MLNSDQLFATVKNNFEQLLANNPAAPESVKKLVELNLQTAQAAFDDASKLAQTVTGAKTPQELLDLQASLLKAATERSLSYGQKLVEIVSSSAADPKFAQSFGGAGQQSFMSVFDNLAKTAPAGSEPMIAAMKNAMSAATSTVETMQKAMSQASSQAQASFGALTGNLLNPSKGGKNA